MSNKLGKLFHSFHLVTHVFQSGEVKKQLKKNYDRPKNTLRTSLATITFSSHVGQFHDPIICQLYFAGPSNKMEIFVVFHTFGPNLDIWVESYSLHYCMRMNYCSSHEYSHETLFITIFLETIHRNTIVENIDTIHNIPTIQTDIIHYSYQRTFLLIF